MIKLRIKMDLEIDPLNPFSPETVGKLESVFGEELPLLCRRLENLAEAEVSVSFLSEAEMRSINKRYRGCDEATDVLSFPLWEENESLTSFGLEQFEPFPLGDIVICPEEAERMHAPMSRMEALCLVLGHGFLHLLGWDHDTPEKEELMWDRQELLKSRLLNAVERGAKA